MTGSDLRRGPRRRRSQKDLDERPCFEGPEGIQLRQLRECEDIDLGGRQGRILEVAGRAGGASLEAAFLMEKMDEERYPKKEE
jgi:hypothetical protein